ncbi:MAG: hypothetical protein K2X03_13550 [Bryobacteraceae bacterium]|nr:hypothetical protein [Bryobacteraceae bacterium]
MSRRALPARLHAAGAEGAQALVWRDVSGADPIREHHPEFASRPEPPAEDLDRLLAEANARAQAAAAQSYRDGFAQGRQEGEQLARAELSALMERLARTVADLSGTRDAFRREAEADVVRLSLGVARRVLHRELSVDPEALLGVIRVALGKFDARELHRILVSPADQPALAAAFASLRLPRQVEVIGDPSLERGAALFETVKGTLDASVDTQLDEIERGFLDVLGKDGRHG